MKLQTPCKHILAAQKLKWLLPTKEQQAVREAETVEDMRAPIQTPHILREGSSPGDSENGPSAPTPGTATVEGSERDKESQPDVSPVNIREPRELQPGTELVGDAEVLVNSPQPMQKSSPKTSQMPAKKKGRPAA